MAKIACWCKIKGSWERTAVDDVNTAKTPTLGDIITQRRMLCRSTLLPSTRR